MQRFSVEHVLPRLAGGNTTRDNLALACQGCNNHKYTKVTGIDPVSARAVPLFDPRRQRWQDHFIWSADFARILGRTPTGRATVGTRAFREPAGRRRGQRLTLKAARRTGAADW
jgi:HNH endonuclease